MKTTPADLPACSIDGCETVAKTMGLCNTHYMASYREQTRVLQAEVATAFATYGAVEGYDCEGDDECLTVPVRWWVREGDPDQTVALCAAHVTEFIESMRLDIRRLEM